MRTWGIWTLTMVSLIGACTPYKKTSYQAGQRLSVGTEKKATSDTVEARFALLLDTKKLMASPGSYQATISFQAMQATPADQLAAAKTTIQLVFDAVAPSVRLPVKGLPTGQPGLLTIEFYQGEALLFIAKHAGVKIAADTDQLLVIDDCRINSAPWDGNSNEGSCAWSITDVPN